MRCAIVDDEMPAVDEIAYLISLHQCLEVTGRFNDGLSFIGSLAREQYDIVFLDINMPQVSGILVLDYILKNEIPIKVVFVTAYEEYAVKAFEMNAVDYLLKPVSEERFAKTVTRIIRDSEHISGERLENIYEVSKQLKKKLRVMSFYKDGVLKPIRFEEIAYVYFEDRVTKFITKQGEFHCKKNLSEIEEILSEQFFRCHRAYILNLDFVKEIEPWFNNTFMVSLVGFDAQIPISRSHVISFKEKMHIL